jgi:hypothetical protein
MKKLLIEFLSWIIAFAIALIAVLTVIGMSFLILK